MILIDQNDGKEQRHQSTKHTHVLEFIFLVCLGPIHGSSTYYEKKWWEQAEPCQKCQKQVTFESGIICMSYGSPHGRFRSCRANWCAECFVPHELDFTTTEVPCDFDKATLGKVDDGILIRQARAGDHLCTTRQCLVANLKISKEEILKMGWTMKLSDA